VQDRLADTMRIIMPDARGHGASSAVTDRNVSMTDLANDAVAILDNEGIAGPVHIVGKGQGAITALELAHWRPDRIASLVLVEPDALTILDGEMDEHVVHVREEARAGQREASDHSYKGLADKALDRYLDRRWGAGWRERLTKIRLASVRRSVQALSPSLDALGRFRPSGRVDPDVRAADRADASRRRSALSRRQCSRGDRRLGTEKICIGRSVS
jgi:pimeloyl-ACP methyl ester carboxylesterase